MHRMTKLPNMVELAKWTRERIAYHSEGCRGGVFAICRCNNATTVRHLDRAIKQYDGDWPDQYEREHMCRLCRRWIGKDRTGQGEHTKDCKLAVISPCSHCGAVEAPHNDGCSQDMRHRQGWTV